ncbi:MAG: hypothetical protein GWN94_20890 [Phycisphaerae bacterium]|nr:hypothetical protein [Phycisphaerae bacterium]NIS53524.1 hypothetical protein [Phycisphaerae bacterium]
MVTHTIKPDDGTHGLKSRREKKNDRHKEKQGKPVPVSTGKGHSGKNRDSSS